MTTDRLQQAIQLHQSGETGAAERLYREILAREPQNAEAMYWLAMLAFQAGRVTESANHLLRAIGLNPGNALAHYGLGAVLAATGQHDRAVSSYRECLRIRPDFAEAYNNLGIALAALGLFDEAAAAYRQAIQCKPDYIEPVNNLGVVLYEQGKGKEAVECFLKVLSFLPDSVPVLQNLGNAYYDQGRLEESLDCYRRVVALSGSDGARIRLATALPIIIPSKASIAEVRASLQNRVDALMHEAVRVQDPLGEIGYTNFLLAYHGLNDRVLQERIASLYLKSCPVLSYTAPHCRTWTAPAGERRIRVGFISSYFKNHSIGKTSRGVIEHLSREMFEVVVIFPAPPADETGTRIAEAADKVVVLPGGLSAAYDRIAGEELDILFYQDTGMDAFTFFLAFARLAPVQCTSFGHPVTTGIPAMDYYISTDYWEPQDAQDHYSEQLVLLKDVASVAYYYKPPFPPELQPRSYFHLSDEDHIYLCPQTLFKIHPDFDDAVGGILRGDPAGRVVFLEGKYDDWSRLLMERFRASIPDVVDRIEFLPQQKGFDFINLIAVSDVMLDTFHFCGFNTTLEGLAAGIPVVTLPGAFMRSRHSLAFYRKMGFMDCVAGDLPEYVDLAVHLATDKQYRDRISQGILERQSCLWCESRTVREFERVFREMVGVC